MTDILFSVHHNSITHTDIAEWVAQQKTPKVLRGLRTANKMNTGRQAAG
jgi:hypothetical protein